MIGGYRLSSIAEQDVASIAKYIAGDNLNAAIRLIDRFTQTFELLAQQPELGESCGLPHRRMRRTSVGNYLVFYQSVDNEILIVRILHGARQWENLI